MVQAHPTPPEGMVAIPGGRARLGTAREAAEALAREHRFHPSFLAPETPERTLILASFALDIFEVTHADYARFVEATGHRTPECWPEGRPPADRLRHPVTHVAWQDARAYAEWVGKRLPTADEWEYAARGPEGYVYPWGDGWDPALVHGGERVDQPGQGTAPVDAHPGNVSPFGIRDLVGNVAEWTATPGDDGTGDVRVVMNVGWCFTEPWQFRAAFRSRTQPAANVIPFVGFRCALDLKPEAAT